MAGKDRRFDPQPDTPARRRVLEAAATIFGTLGFQKASVAAIASAAHVSKPLVYRYFESKEHLYEAVVEGVVTQWNEELMAAMTGLPTSAVRDESEGGSLEDVFGALRAMHRSSLAFAQRSPLLRGLLAQDSRLMLAAFSDVVGDSQETWRNQVEILLRRGIASGQIREDLPIEAIADAVTALHLAYAERIVQGQTYADHLQVAEAAFECILSGIGLQPTPPIAY